jgi:hypothetical protein
MRKFGKTLLFGIVGFLARCSWGRQLLWQAGTRKMTTRVRLAGPPDVTEVVVRRYMLYFMLPLWFAPGVLDWYMHRRTRIQRTSGWQESAIHSVMMMEVGAPILAGLLLEINAGVIVFMLASFFLHWATAFWDVAYATGRREVRPNEQHIHSLLEMLPFCAVSFVICLHWEQFLAALGAGNERPNYSVEWKRDPLSMRYVAVIGIAICAFIAVPYGEELIRCLREGSREQRFSLPATLPIPQE